jgi:hypothetical protein
MSPLLEIVFDLGFEPAPLPIALFDRNLRCLRANRRLESDPRLGAQSWSGRPLRALLPAADDLLSRFASQVLEGGPSVYGLDLRLDTGAPEALRWRASLHPLALPGTAPMGVCLMLADESGGWAASRPSTDQGWHRFAALIQRLQTCARCLATGLESHVGAVAGQVAPARGPSGLPGDGCIAPLLEELRADARHLARLSESAGVIAQSLWDGQRGPRALPDGRDPSPAAPRDDPDGGPASV